MAGLAEVPVLSKSVDDATAEKMHMAENIQRENLSTLELAMRVQRDLDEARGDLAAGAAKYNKQKPWVSKLSAIAQGSAVMADLVEEGVTADRAVLAAVSSWERKAPEQAKALGEQLKAAPAKANKRAITERFMKEQRAPKNAAAKSIGRKNTSSPGGRPVNASEPSWRSVSGVKRKIRMALISVELSPMPEFA